MLKKQLKTELYIVIVTHIHTQNDSFNHFKSFQLTRRHEIYSDHIINIVLISGVACIYAVCIVHHMLFIGVPEIFKQI